jgi:hypothetical protein
VVAMSACLVCGNDTIATTTGLSGCAPCPVNSQAIGRTAVSHSLQTDCKCLYGYFGTTGVSCTGTRCFSPFLLPLLMDSTWSCCSACFGAQYADSIGQATCKGTS